MNFVKSSKNAEIFDAFMKRNDEEYYVFLMKIAYALKNNKDEREDLMQRTLMRIWEKIETFDLDGNDEKNWITFRKLSTTIMKRLAIDDYKSADNRNINRSIDIHNEEFDRLQLTSQTSAKKPVTTMEWDDKAKKMLRNVSLPIRKNVIEDTEAYTASKGENIVTAKLFIELANRDQDQKTRTQQGRINVKQTIKPSSDQEPSSLVARKIAADRLIEFYHQHLPSQQAEVLILKGRFEKDPEEIAEILGIEKTTVYTRTNRAIKALIPHRNELADIVNDLRGNSE